MKLWAGRFQKETDTLVNDFNASITFDARLYRAGHHTAPSPTPPCWAGRASSSRTRPRPIIKGLEGILPDIEAGEVAFSLDNEDIHMNIETHTDPAHRRYRQAAAHGPQPATTRWPWTSACISKRRSPKIHRACCWTWMAVLIDQGGGATCTSVMPGLHPPAAGPAHHLRPLHDGLCQHAAAGTSPGWRTAWSAWTRCPLGGRRAGGHHLSHRPRSCTAALLGFASSPPRTAWTAVSDRDYRHRIPERPAR